MAKVWVKKFKNFAEAKKEEKKYYQKMGKEKRLETIQILRERYSKFGGKNEGRARLRRVVKIVQQV